MSLLDVFVIVISNKSSDSALTTGGMLMAIENEACFVSTGLADWAKLTVESASANTTKHFRTIFTAVRSSRQK